MSARDEGPLRPLRVLFLNDTSRNGGPGRTLYAILKFLDPAVIHRAVVLPHEGVVRDLLLDGNVTDQLSLETNFVENLIEPWDRPMLRQDFDAPLPLRALRATGNVARGTRAVFRLRDLLLRERFDVLFCNGTSANFAGGALAWLTGIPTVWHVFYTSVARPIEPLHAHLAQSAGVRSILCVSEPTTRLFSHCRNKVRVLHDAIDVDEYDRGAVAPVLRRELDLPADAVVFGSQGRILPRKGYLEMIRAARIALDALDPVERPRCKFVVLGDTPEDMRPDHLDECRALVRDLGVSDAVHFLGYRADVRPYASEFDVAVVPSVYEDPLPRVVLESMALGKPVVAFAMGGIPEMVADGATGFLVSGAPPDLEGLARAFVRYFRDASLRREHGMAARRRVENEFNARHHAAAIQGELLRVGRGDG